MSLFGQNNMNKTGFGTTGFGQTGGTSFAQPSGIFGAQTPAASNTLFGSTGTANQATGMFGAAATNTFGQTAQNTSFTGFGGQQPPQQQQQQQPQTGGLFGNTAQQTSTLFSTPSTSTAFGAKTPAPGNFGASTQQQGSTLFGSTPNTGATSLFGATNAAATSGGLFNTSSTAAGFTAQPGTTIKFQPVVGTDTMVKSGISSNISTKHQCITAMKEYETKSLEELRMEDYTANRKGPSAGSTVAGGLFGQTQTTQQPQQPQQPQAGFTGFGQQQQNKQQNTGFSFNQPAATSGTASLFGANQSANIFASTASKPLFGPTTATTTTASAGFGGFGNTGTSLFGQQQTQQQNKGLFAQTPSTQATGSLFGNTQTSSFAGGTFGSTGFNTGTQQAGGLFGGAKPASGFGQTGTTTSSSSGPLFGQANSLTNSGGGLFGNKQPAQTGTGFNFGQTSTAGFGTTGSLFGNKPTGFGAQPNPLGNTTGFGATSGIGTGSLFNPTQNKPAMGLGTAFNTSTAFGSLVGNTTLGIGQGTTNIGPDANNQLNNTAQLQQQLLTLTNAPYGDSHLFRGLSDDAVKTEALLKPTNPLAQKAALASRSQYKVSPRPTAKIKPKPIHNLSNGKSQLFDGLDEEDSSFGNDTFVPRRSVKKLIIKTGDSTASFSKHSSQADDLTIDTSQLAPSPDDHLNGKENGLHISKPPEREDITLPKDRSDRPLSTGLFKNVNESFLNDTISDLNTRTRPGGSLDVSHSDSMGDPETHSQESESPALPHPAGIILRRHGYYTLPSYNELAELADGNGDCVVEDFLIGRDGYGNVMFPGVTNIANMNFDEIVYFRRKEVTVYPEDSQKPRDGDGLNKKAQVTLDCVWPSDKTTREYIKDPARLLEMKYQEKLERATYKIGAKFLDYRPETGSWVFEVKHFSKYGLLDDSDDEDAEMDPKKLQLLKQQQQQQLAVQVLIP